MTYTKQNKIAECLQKKNYFRHMTNGKYFKARFDATNIIFEDYHYGQDHDQSVRHGLKRVKKSGQNFDKFS